MSFKEVLISEGWVEIKPFVIRKGHWEICFDTSDWMELGTEQNPRIFDVPVPNDRKRNIRWTINLISHLFETNDQLETRHT